MKRTLLILFALLCLLIQVASGQISLPATDDISSASWWNCIPSQDTSLWIFSESSATEILRVQAPIGREILPKGSSDINELTLVRYNKLSGELLVTFALSQPCLKCLRSNNILPLGNKGLLTSVVSDSKKGDYPDSCATCTANCISAAVINGNMGRPRAGQYSYPITEILAGFTTGKLTTGTRGGSKHSRLLGLVETSSSALAI
jgi:hypothetical protein